MKIYVLPDEEARDEELNEAPRQRTRHARGHEDGRVDVQDRLPPVAVTHVPANDRACEESAGGWSCLVRQSRLKLRQSRPPKTVATLNFL